MWKEWKWHCTADFRPLHTLQVSVPLSFQLRSYFNSIRHRLRWLYCSNVDAHARFCETLASQFTVVRRAPRIPDARDASLVVLVVWLYIDKWIVDTLTDSTFDAVTLDWTILSLRLSLNVIFENVYFTKFFFSNLFRLVHNIIIMHKYTNFRSVIHLSFPVWSCFNW